MNNNIFELTFEDGSLFFGNLFLKDWGKIPDKAIKQIVFTFGNKPVKMEGFFEYNLVYETNVIVGRKARIVSITLAGRKSVSSMLIIFDCINGKILQKEVEKYKEYEWPCFTWKKGKVGIPRIYHN